MIIIGSTYHRVNNTYSYHVIQWISPTDTELRLNDDQNGIINIIIIYYLLFT